MSTNSLILVRVDVERRASNSVIVISIVKEATDAVQTFRPYARMSTDNVHANYVIHMMMFQIMKLCVHRAKADVVTGQTVIVVVTLNVEERERTVAAKTSRRHVQMSTNNLFHSYVIDVMMFLITKQNVPCVNPLMRFQMIF